jgi:hypothetical protein
MLGSMDRLPASLAGNMAAAARFALGPLRQFDGLVTTASVANARAAVRAAERRRELSDALAYPDGLGQSA